MSVGQSLSTLVSRNTEEKKCPVSCTKLDLKFFGTPYPPNIQHELNYAQLVLEKGSSLTGDNLFDHLAEIIKLVVAEQPENIIDYFEEMSFNLRAKKIKIPEDFPWVYIKPIDVATAMSVMKLMRIPLKPSDRKYDVCIDNPSRYARRQRKGVPPKAGVSTEKKDKEEVPPIIAHRKLLPDENVLRLKLYWALCGFDLLEEEVFQLAYALQKLQYDPTILHARFWGKIYGLKRPYYIAEVQLTQAEIEVRVDKMRDEVIQKIAAYQEKKFVQPVEEDLTLIPGIRWLGRPIEDLEKMKPQALPKPTMKTKVDFGTPPELAGTGVNRKTYFVVNYLDEEWTELPHADAHQIQISRKIKKFLTGDLDAEVFSYPHFPGTERHYLRAMIARITAGTYVAPKGYYRKLTKEELADLMGMDGDETKRTFIADEDEDENDDFDNDALLIENSDYRPNAESVKFSTSWVHVRPNILQQGRVTYFDEVKALQALEKGSSLTFKIAEETGEEGEEEGAGEDRSEYNDEDALDIEPGLFSPCNYDYFRDLAKNWSIRQSHRHNKSNQIIIMNSNVWPGACAYTLDKYADNIYLGWGVKYVTRNITLEHVPMILFEHSVELDEATDPTPFMEEAWRKWNELEILSESSGEEANVEEEEEICY